MSKQFLSRVEAGAEAVTAQLETALSDSLLVLPEFFRTVDLEPITEEQCHFRRQLTTKVALRQVGRARGEMLKRLVSILEENIELPAYRVGVAEVSSNDAIERGAEVFRATFELGMGPLSNITRIAENAGSVVTRLDGLAPEIDAVSFATKRPVIVLNSDGRSSCRERFGIAHELGHFALHIGVLTGDRLTETQANRFASALLMPRATFGMECRAATRGTRLNWPAIVDLKLRWGVSKAAILFRGHQLGYFTEEQVRSGYITLKRHGQATSEIEDARVAYEEPEVLSEGLKMMRDQLGVNTAAVAHRMGVQVALLRRLMPHQVVAGELNPGPERRSNVVDLFGSRKADTKL
ncbi:ImmA/IrrE family metallo-endopeptidase [Solimonas marina]|uniref:ImmA/IrrE family metallo-endopeptidase n=1 Tax=Solimonas marina TaxID=2714601 RepID=UPI0019CF4E82